MPQLVAMNCRRLRPSFLPFSSASSRIRRSTRFCVSLCVGGRYSPLETIWVGMGVAAEAVSAPATRRCSRSLSQLPIDSLPMLFDDLQRMDLPDCNSPCALTDSLRERSVSFRIPTERVANRGDDGDAIGRLPGTCQTANSRRRLGL